MEYAQIEATAHYRRITETAEEITFTYEWKGEAHWPVHVPFILGMQNKDTRALLPWPLIKIGEDWVHGTDICVRIDGINWLSAMYHSVAYPINRMRRMVVFRLLHTARIWNLASWQSGSVPTWRDLHIVKRFLTNTAPAG